MEGTKKLLSPDNLSFWLVLGLTFLLPIFFLPVAGITIDVGKVFFVSVITLLALALWFIGRLVDGLVKVPRSLILGGVFLVALVFLVSALVSPSVRASLLGQGFEVGTFSFILVAALITLATTLTVDSRSRIFRLYVAILAAFVLVALFHLIRLFTGPGILSFGVFTDPLSTPLGKWNDLAIFFGLTTVLSLATLEILPLERLHKIVLYLTLIVSLFFLAIINFTLAWWILAALATIIFVYAVYLNKFESAPTSFSSNSPLGRLPKIPATAMVVLLVSLLLAFTADSLGANLASRFKTGQVEVRPSWSATYDIGRQTLNARPLFGSGPNRFVNQWSLYKPDVLNSTVFWSTDFNAGVGLIPTFVITTGVLGLLTWLFFLGGFLYRGARSVLSFGLGRVPQYLLLSSFLAAVYLWLFNLLYVPNAAIAALAFLLTGVFIAVLVNEQQASRFEFSLLANPKLGFVSVLVLIFLIVVSAALVYLSVARALSVVNFQKALTAFNREGNVDAAETSLTQAVGWSENDVYYRGLSQVSLSRLNRLLSQPNLSPDTARAQFTAHLGNSIEKAKLAIGYDGTNYQNWLNLGGIYEAIVPLGVGGAYEESVKAYNQALEVAPKNPLIYFNLARLEVAHKDTRKAREYLGKALAEKSNYTEALFFLSQIEASEGNVTEAITKADQASLLAPNDVGLFFQLGLLKYTAKDYPGAIDALERATTLTPDYANAMYFLGLSYDKVGRKSDAIRQFDRIGELNPDNQEVKNILKNLTAGREAFANVPPPNNAPEKKKSPPIKETKLPQDEF